MYNICVIVHRPTRDDKVDLIFREYLATFKKTVAMHEVFLCRLASHPIFRKDHNFKVFLSYDGEVPSGVIKFLL